MARFVAIALLALFAAAPAAALAAPADPTQSPFQQSPSQNQVGEQPTPQQAPVQQQTQADDGSIGAGETLLIAAGIVALIGGIWFVISRDAKRATAGRLPSPDVTPGGSATRAARRSRKLSTAERRRRKRGRATK